MPSRLFVDAAAQSTCASPITNVQTTVTLASAAGFTAPAGIQQISVVILDSGNVAWNPANPLATPFEYQTVNNVTGNVLTFGPGGGAAARSTYAGTTPKAFSAGATIAAVFLAEDITAGLVRLDTALSQALTGPLVVPTTLGGTTAPTGYGSLPVKLDDQLLAAPSSLITFAGLPAGFRHLLIDWYARSDSAAALVQVQMRFNNVATATYDYNMTRVNTAVGVPAEVLAATALTVGNMTAATATAGYFASGEIKIKNYSAGGGVGNKSYLAQSSASALDTSGNQEMDFAQGKWRTVGTAINRVDLLAGAGNFIVGSLFTIWGYP